MGIYDEPYVKSDLKEVEVKYSEKFMKDISRIRDEVYEDKIYVSNLADKVGNFEIKMHIIPIILLSISGILSLISTNYALFCLCISLIIIFVKYTKVGDVNENKINK